MYSLYPDCMASRIGHGFHLFNTEYFPNRDYTLEKRQQYIEKMIRFMSQSHTCLEVCVTSNLQTMPTLDSIKEHKLKDMLEQELQVTICTDNRLVSSTTISNEYASIMEHLEISPAQLRQLVLNGMESSFFFGSCKDKKSYTRSFMRYYDAVCKEYGY